jgi:ribosomal protein S18 acetylase RimI-like enzyme
MKKETTQYTIKLYQRPNANPPNRKIVGEIYEIAKSLTVRWFTSNVPDDTLRDLMFNDVFCLQKNGKILSFLEFTSRDGFIEIILCGTRIEFQRQGLGSKLIEHFFEYGRGLGFKTASVMTVPEDVKPVYGPTIRFYEKHGFVIRKRSNVLWENGALLLFKNL